MKTNKITSIKDVKMGQIRQEILPQGFIDRVIKYKEILKEVEKISIEETVSNFQRDIPSKRENELLIWEGIASVYELGIRTNPNWTLKEKEDLFIKLLKTSLGFDQ